MKILTHITASPRQSQSSSWNVGNLFAQTAQELRPDLRVQTVDLWSRDLPEFNGSALNAKYAVLRGSSHSAEQKAAWEKISKLFEEFDSSDTIVISTPMWNFSLPYRLKQYIDLITQPGISFSFNPETGYKGLSKVSRAVVVHASGGSYRPGEPTEAMDFVTPYLRSWLGFIGITQVHAISVAPMLAAPDDVSRANEDAFVQARSLAKRIFAA